MFCGNCGAKVEDGAAFCPACGNAIKKRIDSDLSGEKKTKKKSRKKWVAVGGIAAAIVIAIVLVICNSNRYIDPAANKNKNVGSIVAVSAGDYHTVGLKSDGTVVAVGSNDYGECNVSEWKDIIAVSAGCNHTVGLKTDGTVVAAGENDAGQCEVSEWKDIMMGWADRPAEKPLPSLRRQRRPFFLFRIRMAPGSLQICVFALIRKSARQASRRNYMAWVPRRQWYYFRENESISAMWETAGFFILGMENYARYRRIMYLPGNIQRSRPWLSFWESRKMRCA